MTVAGFLEVALEGAALAAGAVFFTWAFFLAGAALAVDAGLLAAFLAGAALVVPADFFTAVNATSLRDLPVTPDPALWTAAQDVPSTPTSG